MAGKIVSRPLSMRIARFVILLCGKTLICACLFVNHKKTGVTWSVEYYLSSLEHSTEKQLFSKLIHLMTNLNNFATFQVI